MAYIGNTQQNQNYVPAIDYFSGNGSTVAFTLSRPVASVAQVQAVIENVPQNPGDAYTVSGNTITFTSAPPSGTNNIYVYYTSLNTQVIQPGQGTVGTTQLADGVTINFNDGSAAAPSITNTGDTNTGMFFPAADTIAFAEGGTEVMRIDASGNVGIGTSSPSAKLNVTGTSVVANIESTNNNNVMGILFNGSVGGYIGASASTLQFSNSSGTGVAAINSTNFQFNSGYGSVATAYGCRAWVNFNGTGTIAIQASGNVTSLTDLGVGYYQVNFGTAMPDVNYAVAGSGKFDNSNVNSDTPVLGPRRVSSALDTTNVKVSNPNGVDLPIATVMVFR